MGEEGRIRKGILNCGECVSGFISLADYFRTVLGGGRERFQGMEEFSTMRDEIVYQSKKLTELALGGGLRKSSDGLHFLLERSNALAVHKVTQELKLGSS